MNKKTYDFGSLCAVYYTHKEITSLMIVPKGMENNICEERFSQPISLVQLHVNGDEIDIPYAQGVTMVNTNASRALRLISQELSEDKNEKKVVTRLKGQNGEECTHYLLGNGRNCLSSYVTVKNCGTENFDLVSLQSFCINGLTPFEKDDAPECLTLHKMLSYWSAEGRPLSQSAEELNFESCWTKNAVKSEKISQVGTMPCRRYFPFYALEDHKNKVTWAARLAWAGSWQMEAYRHGDNISLSGGLADYETGHWFKTLAPGESITTPIAYITCVQGGRDEACQALTEPLEGNYKAVNQREEDLSPLYNEYCTTWGTPTHEKIKQQLESLKALGLGYFVIDAGWYKSKGAEDYTGDYEINKKAFPSLKETAELIRSYGIEPGIWFEFEVSESNTVDISLLLHRNSKLIRSFYRCFLDMSNAKTHEYIHSKVTKLLEENDFKYIKVDYNDTYGIGADGCESLGEKLRQNVEGIYRFFDELQERIPGLVVENCSSGGHRLEPSMMGRSSMSSFSDAHECLEIPIIAANLQRLVLPRQSQVWAVLRKEDSLKRLNYSMAATFLGRCCISGDITELSNTQMEIVKNAVFLYKKCTPIIKKGKSRVVQEKITSYRKPKGWQAVIRTGENGTLIVFHSFENGGQRFYDIPIDEEYSNIETFGVTAELKDGFVKINTEGDFTGGVILLTKEEK